MAVLQTRSRKFHALFTEEPCFRYESMNKEEEKSKFR